jgi:hypothetical protein
MATSQNGWPAPPARIRTWTIPGANRHLNLADGPAGFILVHLALWFHERIERLNVGIWDEWGAAYRPVRGSETDLSNHASGTAMDLNATQHPLGVRGSFKRAWQYVRIRARLRMYRRAIRWGGDYQYRADEMHFEIDRGHAVVQRVAERLMQTPRGKRILRANPDAAASILFGPRQAA